MNHEKLQSTHKKLSILFTLIVCLVVFVMGFSTLAAKYLNELRIQTSSFELKSQEVLRVLGSQNIPLRQIFFHHITESNTLEERFQRGRRNPQGIISFIIINERNEVVFENILEDVNFWNITVPDSSNIYHSNNIIFQMLDLESKYWQRILFYERIRYSSDIFMRDSLLILIIVLIFSYLVYFLWYRFVWRALRPVSHNLDDMQAFIHNAGHELKTPLAIMRGNLQVLQAEKSYDPELIWKSLSQIDHMNALLESLRELSEYGTLWEKSSLHLKAEVSNIIEWFESMIQEKNISIEDTIKDNFYISAHPYELQVFLSNIIKNAILYNKNSWRIIIEQNKNILEISDTGKGMTHTEKENIFTRFYRWENVRNTQEGLGIGLSLVKKIADMNGWKLEVESELDKGSIFRVIF